MKPSRREFWFCSWCKLLSAKNSENGYCQKCFEAKLIRFIEHSEYSALEAAEARILALENENDSLLKQYEPLVKQSKEDGLVIEQFEARITQLESDNGIFDLTIKRLINTNAAGEADLRGELIKSEARIAKLREALQAVIEKVVHYASAGCIEAYSQYDDTGLCEEVERAQQALSDDRTQGEK